MRSVKWRVELFGGLRERGVLEGRGISFLDLEFSELVRRVLDRRRRSSSSSTSKDALCTPRSDDGPLSLKWWGN